MSDGNKKIIFSPLPVYGDLVWCYFPEDMGNKKPKARPVLVLSSNGDDNTVIVAFGTTQKTDNIYPEEFFLMDDGSSEFLQSGLSYSTKFDLYRLAKLKFNSDHFCKAKGPSLNVPPPKLGSLHISYGKKLKVALGNAKKKKSKVKKES